jgi:cell division septum initiation protein DivIVA
MSSDRRRILELALESLQNKKKQLEQEIAEIAGELRGGTAKTATITARRAGDVSIRKRSRFSKEERFRRSQRMKAYWENWRKKKVRQKQS